MGVQKHRFATFLRSVSLFCILLFLAECTLPMVRAADATPTLAEIAKANEATWNAITSVDVEYVSEIRCMEDGKLTRNCQATSHWSKSGNLERLRKYPMTIKVDTSHFGIISQSGLDTECQDYFFDGKTTRHMRDANPKKEKKELTCTEQKGLYAEIFTNAEKRPSHTYMNYLEPLRYLSHDGLSGLSLSKIINSWSMSLRGKQTASNGDTLWLLHAEYPSENAKDESAGSYLDIEVNANKGFLVQKVLRYANGMATDMDGKPVGIYSTEEVKEFLDCGHGLFFPKRTTFCLLADTKQWDPKNNYSETFTATKLSVNSPMPMDAFDFRFPENAVVFQDELEEKSTKVFIWGSDNKPAKNFDSRKEFAKYAEKDEQERLTQRVQKNLASKKPADLLERGQYYMQTKKYDESIALFSEVLAIAPKADEADAALCHRAMTYLFSQDFGKAVADFTEMLHAAAQDDDVTTVYYLRGIAYANQETTLDKAVADFAIFLKHEKDDPETQTGAYLVRSRAIAP